MRQPEELHCRLNRMAQSLLCLIPHGDDVIQHHLGDDKFLSLISHVYAVAEKAVCITDDKTCVLLVQVACRIALNSQHIDVATKLCHKRLQVTGTSGNIGQHWEGANNINDCIVI